MYVAVGVTVARGRGRVSCRAFALADLSSRFITVKEILEVADHVPTELALWRYLDVEPAAFAAVNANGGEVAFRRHVDPCACVQAKLAAS